jgi:hypothetical protein
MKKLLPWLACAGVLGFLLGQAWPVFVAPIWNAITGGIPVCDGYLIYGIVIASIGIIVVVGFRRLERM